jgi:hypothetical protein
VQNAILLHASLEPGTVARWSDPLLRALPYARRLQLESAEPSSRWASLGGIALALTGARRAGRASRVGDFVFEADAKPRFRDGPFFSLSHTTDRVGCVVASTLDVGLDLERAPGEAARAPLHKLLGWTAAEATLKAAGLGLRHLAVVRADPDTLTAVLDGRHYVLREVWLGPHTVGHVAATEPLALEVAELALDGDEASAAVECALGLAPQRA